MTLEIAAFLLLMIVGIILFASDRFPADTVALGLLVALIITGMLTPEQAFAGFGSNTVIMILGLLIITEALAQTGMIDIVGRRILALAKGHPGRIAILLMVAPALTSSLMSNTASAAFFLPIALGIARRLNVSASKLLMPLAFATILASSVTLVGTSTNIVVSGLIEQQDMQPIGMFELTPIGLPIMLAGLAYMYAFGRHLIPNRAPIDKSDAPFADRLYITEIGIPEGSPHIGRSIEQALLGGGLELGVLQLFRDKQRIKPLAETLLQAHDALLIEGSKDDILALNTQRGIEIKGKIESLGEYMRQETTQIVEVVLLPGSPLIGRTIKGLRLRERYRLQILAMNQNGELRYNKIGRQMLRLGDVLIIKLPQENIRSLERERLFRVLDFLDTPRSSESNRLAWRTLAIFLGVLLLATFNILPIAVAVLLGAVLTFFSGSITPDDAYRNINWRVLMLIGSMLAFGQAMSETGAAEYLADNLTAWTGDGSPRLVLSIFFLTTVALTQVMSNQAAAAVLLPIALQAANQLGYDPRPFAMMIAVAASASFITPLEPACMMVYGAGRYKFFDFTRVGFPLTVIIYVIAIVLVPILWQP